MHLYSARGITWENYKVMNLSLQQRKTGIALRIKALALNL